MPIALHHLIRRRRGLQVQPRAHERFHVGVHVREGADGARDLAHADVGDGVVEALTPAPQLVPQQAQLPAKGHRLRVDAVAATDADGVDVLAGTALEHGQHAGQLVPQQHPGFAQLHGERGVEHVGAGHAFVEVTSGLADVLPDVGQERDDVVLEHALERIDTLDVELRARAAGRGGAYRHLSPRLHRFARQKLDLQHDLKATLDGPERHHLGAAVAGDHLDSTGAGPYQGSGGAAPIGSRATPLSGSA